jgi:hypothetical protein
MSRAPSSFRETDVKRAIRAIERAGKKAGAVEMVKGGVVRITIKDSDEVVPVDTDSSEWDEKYGAH